MVDGAVISDGYDSEYIVMRNSDRKVMSGAIVIFPESSRNMIPIVEALGLKLKADALREMWMRIDEDKRDMAKGGDE